MMKTEPKEKLIELVGGPLDGARYSILPHITTFEQCNVGTVWHYLESSYPKAKDGFTQFLFRRRYDA